ncbi:1581_t:CDS:2, partial [Acaulospora morrowiae]
GVEGLMPRMDSQNQITELDLVAYGGSSRVLKKMLVINGNETPVAMKIVNKKSNEADRELKTYSEIKTHENIIKFYESRHGLDGSYTFILEYGELGSLREVSVPVTKNVNTVALPFIDVGSHYAVAVSTLLLLTSYLSLISILIFTPGLVDKRRDILD